MRGPAEQGFRLGISLGLAGAFRYKNKGVVYTIEQADRVAAQLEKFTTGFAHHVAGQHGNLDFWLSEVEHALFVIDDYSDRFKRMAQTQKDWVEEHDTRLPSLGFCPMCGGRCEFETGDARPVPPKRISSRLRDQARRRLRDATYQFLLRCYRQGLLDKDEVEQHCARVGTGLDPGDLPHRNE